MYEKYDNDTFDKYVSNLNLKNSVYTKLANDKFSNPNERYQPFLTDPVMMSIVNEKFEFQIGNIVYKYLDNEFLLAYNFDDASAKNEVRSLKRGDHLSIDALPKGTVLLTDESYDALKNPFQNQNNFKNDILELNKSYKSGICIKGERDTGWGWKETSNDAISFRSAAYYSWGRTYEESKVYGYAYANGTWSNVNKDLGVSITAYRRSKSCVQEEPEQEIETCESCKNKRARVNIGGKRRHQTDDVYGNQRMYREQSGVQSTSDLDNLDIIIFE